MFHTNHPLLYSGKSSILSAETARPSETLVPIHKTARCHIPEGSNMLCYTYVSLLQGKKDRDPGGSNC
jgi:hypothetical protein